MLDRCSNTLCAILMGCSLLLSSVSAAKAVTPVNTGSGSLVIKGSVEHREILPPVDPMYKTGVTLDRSKLPKFAAGSRFYPIPLWMAGKWHHDQQITYYSFDYGSGTEDRGQHIVTARGDEELGWQQDRNGGIWQYENAPFSTVMQGDGHYTVQICKSIEPLSVSEKQLSVRFRGIDLRVDSSTNKILASNQIEKVQVYTPGDYGPGYNKCVASVKSFDQEGKPLRLSQVITTGVRTGSYSATDQFNGRDMRLLFSQYLLSRGYTNLIPTAMLAFLPTTPTYAPRYKSKPVIQELKAKQEVLKQYKQ